MFGRKKYNIALTYTDNSVTRKNNVTNLVHSMDILSFRQDSVHHHVNINQLYCFTVEEIKENK